MAIFSKLDLTILIKFKEFMDFRGIIRKITGNSLGPKGEMSI
jgi:hypothetical protein